MRASPDSLSLSKNLLAQDFRFLAVSKAVYHPPNQGNVKCHRQLENQEPHAQVVTIRDAIKKDNKDGEPVVQSWDSRVAGLQWSFIGQYALIHGQKHGLEHAVEQHGEP